MRKSVPRLSRLGVLAPAALSACIDASVLAAPAAGAIVSTVLKELSKAFMLKKWFHGVMSSQEAEQLLLQKGNHGSYMVRESRAHPGKYVLSVRVRTRVTHVMIRKEEKRGNDPRWRSLVESDSTKLSIKEIRQQNKYDVGCGEIFDDLSGLIEHCRAYPLTEASGEVLRLRQPVCGARARSKHLPEEPTDKRPAKKPVMGEAAPRPEQQHPSLMQNEVTEEEANATANNSRRAAEFNRIKNTPKIGHFTAIEGHKPVNISKNRYADVIPYDQTRVHLPRTAYFPEQGGTDYCNASYIRPVWMFEMMVPYLNGNPRAGANFHHSNWEDIHAVASATADPDKPWWLGSTEERCAIYMKSGVPKDKFYIAAQGPLEATKEDFWAMVADNEIRVICMVTECVEKNKEKCLKYWPDIGCVLDLVQFKIENIAECVRPDYNTREFLLTNKLNNETKRIDHFEYKGWIDHRIPTDLHSIIDFIHTVNVCIIATSRDPSPPKHNIMCVHCSAGIGRTGTFIALDMLLETGKIENEIIDEFDIPKIVTCIRQQRAGMVQNLNQYEFLYDASFQYQLDEGLLFL